MTKWPELRGGPYYGDPLYARATTASANRSCRPHFTRPALTVSTASASKCSGKPFAATERQATGLGVVWRLGLRPRDGAEGTLDCNFFRVENQAGVPDEFVITTRVQREGLIQRVLVEQLGGTLHGKPAGQETISDDLLRAGVLLP